MVKSGKRADWRIECTSIISRRTVRSKALTERYSGRTLDASPEGEVRMTIGAVWACERSVDAGVPVSFAWQFMSDLGNWSDPPAEFSLDGPFADGSVGTTRMPGRPPATWTLRDVKPGRAYTIEGGSFLERAQFMVFWRFDPRPDGRTMLTQRMELRGENASAYVADISAAFEPNLEPGMRRIAGLMEAAFQTGAATSDP
jgi:hypothetical protein